MQQLQLDSKLEEKKCGPFDRARQGQRERQEFEDTAQRDAAAARAAAERRAQAQEQERQHWATVQVLRSTDGCKDATVASGAARLHFVIASSRGHGLPTVDAQRRTICAT